MAHNRQLGMKLPDGCCPLGDTPMLCVVISLAHSNQEQNCLVNFVSVCCKPSSLLLQAWLEHAARVTAQVLQS